MQKNFKKRIICLLLAMMLALPNVSGLQVYAGTGYPDNLLNGDFEADTLTGWNLISGSNEENITKELKSDIAGKYLEFNSKTNWKGIESEPFVISNIQNGDKLFVAYDWSGDTNFRIDLEKVSGVTFSTSEGNTNSKDRLTEKRSGWKSSFSQQGKAVSDVTAGTDAVFKVVIKEKDNANTTSTLIDNVAVYIIRGDIYYDIAGKRVMEEQLYPYYGTNEKGIYAVKTVRGKKVMNLTPLDITGDNPFSLANGLKYWGPKNDKNGYGSDYASVREGVLTVNGVAAWDGVECVRITLPEQAQGRKLKVSYLYKNTTQSAGQMKFRAYKGTTDSATTINLSKNVTEWTPGGKEDITVDAATEAINLLIEAQATGATMQFKDIKLYYQDLEGQYVEFFAPPEPEDVNVGTKDGILTTETNGIYSIEATNGFINGEFTHDLKYWGTEAANTRPSAYATIKTKADATDKYITLAGNNTEGIVSRSFTLPEVIAYDQIGVMFDYKGDLNDVDVEFRSLDNLETVSGDGTKASVYTSTSEGWNTAVVGRTITAKQSGTVYTLSMLLKKDGASIDIDNVRIVRVTGEDTYTALNGGTLQFSDEGSTIVSDEVNVGTYTEGIITGGANKINTITRTEQMMNGDFEQGFMYWGTRSGESPKVYATLKNESDGNTYVTFKAENYKDITMRRFIVAGLQEGDKVALMGDYRSSSKSLVFKLELVNGAASTSGSDMTELFKAEDPSKWSTAASKTLTLGAVNEDSLTKYETNEYIFQMRAESSSAAGSPISVDLDNFRIVKAKPDGTYTELDGTPIVFKNPDGSDYNPLTGTYADGIVTGTKNGILQMAPSDKMYNGDFEQGLKYWGTRSGESPKVYATLKKEGNNTYATFKGADYQDIAMRRFIVSGLKAGDKVAVMGNYRSSSKSLVFKLELVNGKSTTSGAMTDLFKSEDASKWNTAASQTLTLGAVDADSQSKYETTEYVFQMRVESSSAKGSPISVDIDNFKIVKVKADGTYTELDGTPIVFKNADGSIYNPLMGTYADGIVTGAKNGILQMKPSDKMYNGDFEQGLMYWGTRSGESPKKYATLKKQGNNTYITFRGADYQDISMRRFIVSGLKAGEKIAVMGDFKGSTKSLVFKLELVNGTSKVSGNAITEVFKNPNKSGWSTAVSQNLTLGAVNGDSLSRYETKEYVFQMRVESSSAKGSPISVDVDNLRIVKVKADGTYTELNGTPIIFRNPDGSIYNPLSGSYEEGIVTGSKWGINQLEPTEKFQNGDFEEGFKWWATVEGCSPKDYATIKKEDGNTYINMQSSDWKGIVQSKFYAPELKKGDKLAVMVNYRGDTGFQMVLNAWNIIDTEKNRAVGKEILYEPTQEGEWGIAVTRTTFEMTEIDKTLIEKYGDRLMFRLSLQPESGEIVTDFDNVRIVRVNADGSYSEMDGTPITIPVSEEGSGSSTDSLLDWDWGEDDAETSNDGEKQSNVLVIVCIAVGAAVVIAGGVLAFLAVKKRKKTETTVEADKPETKE